MPPQKPLVDIFAHRIWQQADIARERREVRGRVERHYRLDGKIGVESRHGGQMAPGRFADQSDARGIDLVLNGVVAEESNGSLHIVDGATERDGILGEPVINGKTTLRAGAGERYEERRHFRSAVSANPAAAVNQDGRREWAISFRNSGVEKQRLAAGARILDSAYRFGCSGGCRKKHKEGNGPDAKEHPFRRCTERKMGCRSLIK